MMDNRYRIRRSLNSEEKNAVVRATLRKLNLTHEFYSNFVGQVLWETALNLADLSEEEGVPGAIHRKDLQQHLMDRLAPHLDKGVMSKNKINKVFQVYIRSCFVILCRDRQDTESGQEGTSAREQNTPISPSDSDSWSFGTRSSSFFSTSLEDPPPQPPVLQRHGSSGSGSDWAAAVAERDEDDSSETEGNEDAGGEGTDELGCGGGGSGAVCVLSTEATSAKRMVELHNEFIMMVAQEARVSLTPEEWTEFFSAAERWEAPAPPQPLVKPVSSSKRCHTKGSASHSDPLGFLGEGELESFRTQRCTRREPHSTVTCIFAHPEKNGPNDVIDHIRRNPRQVQYVPRLCCNSAPPKVCRLADNCPFAHSQAEVDYHPSVYKARPCPSGAACTLGRLCSLSHIAAPGDTTFRSDYLYASTGSGRPWLGTRGGVGAAALLAAVRKRGGDVLLPPHRHRSMLQEVYVTLRRQEPDGMAEKDLLCHVHRNLQQVQAAQGSPSSYSSRGGVDLGFSKTKVRGLLVLLKQGSTVRIQRPPESGVDAPPHGTSTLYLPSGATTFKDFLEIHNTGLHSLAAELGVEMNESEWNKILCSPDAPATPATALVTPTKPAQPLRPRRSPYAASPPAHHVLPSTAIREATQARPPLSQLNFERTSTSTSGVSAVSPHTSSQLSPNGPPSRAVGGEKEHPSAGPSLHRVPSPLGFMGSLISLPGPPRRASVSGSTPTAAEIAQTIANAIGLQQFPSVGQHQRSSSYGSVHGWQSEVGGSLGDRSRDTSGSRSRDTSGASMSSAASSIMSLSMPPHAQTHAHAQAHAQTHAHTHTQPHTQTHVLGNTAVSVAGYPPAYQFHHIQHVPPGAHAHVQAPTHTQPRPMQQHPTVGIWPPHPVPHASASQRHIIVQNNNMGQHGQQQQHQHMHHVVRDPRDHMNLVPPPPPPTPNQVPTPVHHFIVHHVTQPSPATHNVPASVRYENNNTNNNTNTNTMQHRRPSSAPTPTVSVNLHQQPGGHWAIPPPLSSPPPSHHHQGFPLGTEPLMLQPSSHSPYDEVLRIMSGASFDNPGGVPSHTSTNGGNCFGDRVQHPALPLVRLPPVRQRAPAFL